MHKRHTPSDESQRLSLAAGLLLGAFFLLLTLGPRVPLNLGLARRADLRLHEVLLIPMLFVCIYWISRHGKFTFLKSPWHPFFSISLILASVTFLFKVITSTQSPILSLGYSYRAMIFFALSVIVAILAFIAQPHIKTILIPSILLSFSMNSFYVIWNGIRGVNATFTDAQGEKLELYGPGLIGEQNALAAGIFFIYLLTSMIQWPVSSRREQIYISLGMLICLVSIYYINNRSIMIMAAVAILIGAVLTLARRNFKAFAFSASLLVIGVFAFYFVNPRSTTEGIGEALSLGRLPQWERSISLISSDYFFGWELGTNEAHQAFLRLWGEWGLMASLAFLLLLLYMIMHRPSREVVCSPGSNYWVNVLRMFIVVLLIGGLFTDSLTPVISWDLLSFSVGLAWATWGASAKLSQTAELNSKFHDR